MIGYFFFKIQRSLGIESFEITNLACVSIKLYFNFIFTMQTYKELITFLLQIEVGLNIFPHFSLRL